MMRKLIWSLCLLILTYSNLLFGQNNLFQIDAAQMNNTSIPNVSSFIRYKENSLNHYSGRANISIPIYTIKTGDLTYPISLNYSGGGIQVNSKSSNVGLGWSLTDTFVNRTIVGEADWETLPNNYGSNCEWNGGADHLKIGFFARTGPTNGLTKQMDYYPDIFKMLSPTYNSSFYFLTKDIVKELEEKGTKIEWNTFVKKYNYLSQNNQPFNNNICIKDYLSFNITTKSGVSYFFDKKDITHSFQSHSGGLYDAIGHIGGTYPRISTWHISEISDFKGNSIQFIYEDYSTNVSNEINYILNHDPFYRFEFKKPMGEFNLLQDCMLWGNYFIDGNSSGIGESRFYNRMLKIQRLKKIVFNEGYILFDYNMNRTDFKNGKALTNIYVKNNNGKTIKQFDLEYEYFNSDIQVDERSKRLKLSSIKESGKNKYLFDYYEDNNLPNIGSVFQDFFGYHNQAESDYNSSISSKYYFYPNRREYSLLPYDIENDSNHYTLSGQIIKEPNDLSKTWSLKKIIFPTGGSNEFELESNEFNLWGNNLKGGGVRVKKQIIKENNFSTPRVINYSYIKDSLTNTSSGVLLNVPNVGNPAIRFFDSFETSVNLSNFDNLKDYFYLYTNSKLNYDLLNNFFVGYSKIIETEGEKKMVSEFTLENEMNEQTRSYYTFQGVTNFDVHCLSSFLYRNSGLGNNIFIDNSHKRGKIKKKLFYYNNNVIKKIENFYDNFKETGEFHYTSMDGIYFTGANIIPNSSMTTYNQTDFLEIMESTKSYSPIYNNLIKTITTDFYSTGNIENIVHFIYDQKQNIKSKINKLHEGSEYPYYEKINYYYPYNFSDELSLDLLNDNRISKPIRMTTIVGELDLEDQQQTFSQIKKDSKVIFKKDESSNYITLPEKIKNLNINTNQFYDEITYDRYDAKGNLLQYTTKEGIPTAIVWGYEQTQPIAQIVGATYAQVEGLMDNIVNKSNLDADTDTEQQLIDALDAFRKLEALQDYQITTYTHNPLIGVTSITPPSGIRQVYLYDEANHLKEVREGSTTGKLLQTHEYHYKP